MEFELDTAEKLVAAMTMPPWPEPGPAPEPTPEKKPVRSFARGNVKLGEAFERYLIARGQSPQTIRAYLDSVSRFVEQLGPANAVAAGRAEIRTFQGTLLDRGLSPKSVELHTAALRSFFKWLSLTGLTRGHNPTLLLSHRKTPGRLPRVLTVSEVEKLISAAKTPVEIAIVEVLYATGVRVSELVNLRFEDVDFGGCVIRVKNGKGSKDRIVLFGSKALLALLLYLNGHRPEFLFEVLPGLGTVHKSGKYWVGAFSDKDRHRAGVRYVGRVSDLPESEDAMRVFKEMLSKEPSFRPGRPGPYSVRHIRTIISGLGARAGIGHVHPHALRRAFATHLLEGGADLRVIQELMGHVNLRTTMIYTSLSAAKLKEIHDRCHPHAKGADDAKEK